MKKDCAANQSDPLASLLASVDDVAPIAAAHAAEAERVRTLPRPVVEALQRSGLFAMATPRALGGAECGPLAQLEVFEAMAKVDASAGWGLMIGAMTAALAGGYLPDAGAGRVFAPDASPLFAGAVAPAGTAERVDGGYRIRGRWPFGSGVRHADWVLTSAVIVPTSTAPTGAPPEMISFVVPIADVVTHDTWHVAGLKGTGSDDYSINGAFVADDETYSFPAAAPRRGGALFALPLIAFLSPAHAGFALGVARRALDEIAALAPQRSKAWSSVTLGSHAGFQTELGRREATLQAARAYAVSVFEAMTSCARDARPLGPREWASIRMATTYVTEVAADAARFSYTAGGGRALYEGSILQRCFRDLHAATQHIAATDEAYEFGGRVQLGLETAHPLLAPRAAPIVAARGTSVRPFPLSGGQRALSSHSEKP